MPIECTQHPGAIDRRCTACDAFPVTTEHNVDREVHGDLGRHGASIRAVCSCGWTGGWWSYPGLWGSDGLTHVRELPPIPATSGDPS